jgi:hypothetical protein
VSIQVKVVMQNGQVITGINWRMSSYGPWNPSVPASPYPFAGGVFHLKSPSGWVDVEASQVRSFSVTPTTS